MAPSGSQSKEESTSYSSHCGMPGACHHNLVTTATADEARDLRSQGSLETLGKGLATMWV